MLMMRTETDFSYKTAAARKGYGSGDLRRASWAHSTIQLCNKTSRREIIWRLISSIQNCSKPLADMQDYAWLLSKLIIIIYRHSRVISNLKKKMLLGFQDLFFWEGLTWECRFFFFFSRKQQRWGGFSNGKAECRVRLCDPYHLIIHLPIYHQR